MQNHIFRHFEAFLMLFENLLENNKVAKYVLEFFLFCHLILARIMEKKFWIDRFLMDRISILTYPLS